MSLFTRLVRGKSSSTWSRPRRWVGRRWKAFVLDCGRIQVFGVARLGFGSALVRWEIEGVSLPLIPISYYGDLTMMQRRRVADGQGEGVLSAASMEWKPLKALNCLLGHAAVTRYEDGTPRRPGRITVETRGALWQVSLTDPDACAVLRVSAPTFGEAVQAANLLLESPDTLWEPAPWLQEGPKKGKRK